jgi:XRE family aerobic/anaerobic benzoate catabolism transcriptional regulator
VQDGLALPASICDILHEMQRHRSWLANLGTRVRELRKARGWSRRQLAGATEISERFLADVEAGAGNPSLLRLFEIADALGTTPGALLGEAQRAAEAREAGARTIALLGLRGAGKSSVGKRLARALGWRFVELDAQVEQRAGLTLPEIFAIHGESHFRRLEREALLAVLEEARPTVLATGGGIVTDPETFDLLKRRATTVWLRAKPADHWSRVVAQGDTRPMANNAQAFRDLGAILAQRERLYQQAQVTVETSGRSVAAVGADLAAQFKTG